MLAVTNSSVPSTSTGSRDRARRAPRRRPRDRAAGVVRPQHDDELVATEAGEHVAVADRPHRRGARDIAAEQLVADAVTEAVVDDLEVVEVDEQHGDGARARRPRAWRRRWASSSVRLGRPVSSSWVAAHCSRSAVRRCSVTSSMWVIASATPSSSVTATRVRAQMYSPSARR